MCVPHSHKMQDVPMHLIVAVSEWAGSAVLMDLRTEWRDLFHAMVLHTLKRSRSLRLEEAALNSDKAAQEMAYLRPGWGHAIHDALAIDGVAQSVAATRTKRLEMYYEVCDYDCERVYRRPTPVHLVAFYRSMREYTDPIKNTATQRLGHTVHVETFRRWRRSIEYRDGMWRLDVWRKGAKRPLCVGFTNYRTYSPTLYNSDCSDATNKRRRI